MEKRKITKSEQSCLSDCILSHWGASTWQTAPENRDKSYEKCLEGCRICA